MKKVMWITIFIFVHILSSALFSNVNVDKVLSKMTLEEKAKLVVGMGMRFPGAPAPSEPTVGQTEDRVPGAAGSTCSFPSLDIPSIVVADGPAGLRIASIRNNDSTKTYYATAFPIATLLASTWDEKLVEKAGKIIGNEVLEYGVDIILMPALNLHRHPLCGRNFEYYSEDPLLNGKITAAMVRGIQSNGVGTSIKHFAANNQETNRNKINTIVSERALRELYLKGFEIAVKESNPMTVMSSYNKINGIYASESYDLLTTILRKDWGFEGFVMTDWFGGKDAIAQMKAGNDLLMPGRPEQSQQILQAVNDGSLDVKILDINVKRILNILYHTPSAKKYKYSDEPDLTSHANVARAAATEGMILLKNDNSTLPLPNCKIALFGNSSYDLIVGGTGSGDVNEAYCITLEQALKNAGYVLDEALSSIYVKYLAETRATMPKPRGFFQPIPPLPQMPAPIDMINNLAEQADVALITIGRNSGEFSDRKLDDDFYLNDVEQDLINKVSEAFHNNNRNVIVVLNIGGVIEVASWRDKVDAILCAWQPGQEGGNPIIDILSGKVNPSGKLSMSFPIKWEDVPASNNFPGTPAEHPEQVVYQEGIFVGYRYYTSFNVETAYEFGYGLSYTNFKYGKIKLSSRKFTDKLVARVKIKNIGGHAGKEVAQLYLSAPSEKMDKPIYELKGFAKTKLLQPGESQELLFELDAHSLSSFDASTSSWIAEPGPYIIKIGPSSRLFKQTKSFNLTKELVVEKLNKALMPQAEISELRSNR